MSTVSLAGKMDSDTTNLQPLRLIIIPIHIIQVHFAYDVRSTNDVATCEIKLFQNYFSLRRRPSEIMLFKIISKLFQRLIAAHKYFQCG